MRLAERLMLLAHWLMPAAEKEWTRAMRAELRYIHARAAAAKFAAGCLWFAWLRRCTAACQCSPAELAVGTCAGAVFSAHAFIPNSQSWPWLWPALGGVLIGIGRAQRGEHLGWSIVWSGLKAGVVCAGVILACGSAVFAVAASHFDDAVVWRGIGLIVYGAFGALLLAPVTAAAATAVGDRLR